MILTNEQLRTFIKGALQMTETETGYLSLNRFSAKGEAFYDTVKDFGMKARATSCIRMEMRTDSSFLEFEYTLKVASSRKFAYFDLAVDGAVLYHEGFENIHTLSGKMHMELPEGEHHIVLYLPNLCKAELKNVTLSDGATLSPVEKSCKLFCIGDSITQGYDAKFSSGSYTNLLADMMDAEVVNQGIGGEIFRPDMLDGEMDFTPDYITVSYGTNDWSGQKKEDVIANAIEYFKRLRAYFPHAKIFAITPIWRTDNFRYTRVGTFAEGIEIVENAARAVGATVVNGNRLVPHTNVIFSDAYLHPNDLGFRYYAQNLYNAIKAEL